MKYHWNRLYKTIPMMFYMAILSRKLKSFLKEAERSFSHELLRNSHNKLLPGRPEKRFTKHLRKLFATEPVVRRSKGHATRLGKRDAVYIDENNSFLKRIGLYVDHNRGAGVKRSAVLMDGGEGSNERTPLLQDDPVIRQIIDQSSSLDEYSKDLISQGEALSATTAGFEKIPKHKKSIWSRLCCCCCSNDDDDI